MKTVALTLTVILTTARLGWSTEIPPAATEAELLAHLRPEATAVEKAEACKRLRTVGTAKAVPALAPLLTDERLSQPARHALEGIATPEADAALRAALPQTTGWLRAGIADSLGWRRDAQAVLLLRPLLAETNAVVAGTAAAALGRIGGVEALAALRAARETIVPAARPDLIEALLRCAEALRATGQLSEAREIYRSLTLPAEAEAVRVAAHAGLLHCAGADALSAIREALAGNDAAAQIAALSWAHEFATPDAVKTLAELLPSASPAMQVALLTLLAKRGDVTVLPAVLPAARSTDTAVKVAALLALGKIGDAGVIPLLAEAATSRDAAVQRAARAALAKLHHGPVTEALVAQLQTSTPAVQVELTRALTARGEKSAVPALLALARTEQPDTRRAALQALGTLVDGQDIQALVSLLTAAESDEARDEVKSVFAALAERLDAPATIDAKPIARALKSGTPAQREALLQIGALFVDEHLRAAFRAALADPDTAFRRAAERAVCGTRDIGLLPDLIRLAQGTTDWRPRADAIQGIVRLATDDGAGLTTAQRAEALAAAFALATRIEDQRRVLSGLARVPDSVTLALAEEAAANPEVRAEADLASLQIARQLAATDFEVVGATLTRLAASPQPGLRTNAQALLQRLNSGWLYAGPYRQSGQEAQALFDVVFPPESGESEVNWQRLINAAGAQRPGEVDLPAVVGGDHAVLYLKTRLYVPIPQPVTFLLGSDDGIKLWVNGELIHSHNAVRGLTPDEDKATGRLRQGWNELLVKITQHTGGCGLMLRVTQPDGKDVPGWRLDPRGGLTPLNTGFLRVQLSDQFYTEGAHYADFNRDGHPDVVAGPYWFAGPDFTRRHEYRPARTFSPKEYSDNFLTYAGDLNGDDWPDILCVPFPGKEGYWYENPGTASGHWPQHLYQPMVGNESPVWGDVTGDGRPELIFCNEGYLGYAGPDPAQPTQPWTFHPISQQDKRYQRFTHGIGLGDVNGDGRSDLVEAVGWWEQPAQPQPGQPWIFHPFKFAAAGAQMLVYDVDGDGHADIITTWHAHEYGLLWWQQVPRPGQSPDWKQHVILSPQPDPAAPALRISQLHALDLADMNGDGLMDIVTGKRFWAHGPAGDPEPNAPAVLYWFELRREPGGRVTFIPHLIDDDSGVGTQVTAADLTGDGRPDVIVGNKKGIFLHLQK